MSDILLFVPSSDTVPDVGRCVELVGNLALKSSLNFEAGNPL